MTLITKFNHFWKEFKEKQLSPNETMLFFYLLNVWNSSGRNEQFECNTKEIELILGMNKMTFTRCRDALSKRGLIQYVKGDRKVKSPYYIICDVTNDVTNDVTKHVTNDVTNDVTKHVTNDVTKHVTNDVTNDVTTHRVLRDKEKERISKDIPKKDELSSHTSTERMDWCAFMQTFNDMLSPGVPKLISMSQSRRDKVKAIIKEYGKEAIIQVFDKIQKSDFLMGRTRKPNDTWKCNFDFIFSKSGFIKILEGNYDNGGQIQTTDSRTSSKPSFNNFNESEAKHVGRIESIEL